MPGRNIKFLNNSIYHVVNRSIASQSIFLNKRNYQRALLAILYYQSSTPRLSFSDFFRLSDAYKIQSLINKFKNQSKLLVEILTYCLMPTHFHILLKQKDPNGISSFVSNFTNSYTRYFNILNNRNGPIFQGRFKAIQIDSDEQLIHTSRYIHLNPYSSGLVKKISEVENYPYSSYGEYLGSHKSNYCNKKVILDYFKDIESFKRFVNDQADYQQNLQTIKML